MQMRLLLVLNCAFLALSASAKEVATRVPAAAPEWCVRAKSITYVNGTDEKIQVRDEKGDVAMTWSAATGDAAKDQGTYNFSSAQLSRIAGAAQDAITQGDNVCMFSDIQKDSGGKAIRDSMGNYKMYTTVTIGKYTSK